MDYNFANDLLTEIEEKLYQRQEQGSIEIWRKNYNLPMDYKFVYDTNNYCLPFFIGNSTSVNRIDRQHFEIFFNSIKDEHPRLVEHGIDESIDEALQNCYPPETILMTLSGKLHNLAQDYNKVLKITRERDYLQGIYDEQKLIINHLNRYYTVLSNADLQIEIGMGIMIDKELTNLFLRAVIRFLEYRLTLLNPVITQKKSEENSISNTASQKRFRFTWNGTQKDLLELIVTLQENNWINAFDKREISQASKAICELFDIGSTRKSESSDPIGSFGQILKGEINSETQKREYGKIFPLGYKYNFDKILKLDRDLQ